MLYLTGAEIHAATLYSVKQTKELIEEQSPKNCISTSERLGLLKVNAYGLISLCAVRNSSELSIECSVHELPSVSGQHLGAIMNQKEKEEKLSPCSS